MKLYIVSTPTYDYDEYDSHVIAAKDENEAKKIAFLPGDSDTWEVKQIGTTKIKAGIIHSSFNAG